MIIHTIDLYHFLSKTISLAQRCMYGIVTGVCDMLEVQRNCEYGRF